MIASNNLYDMLGRIGVTPTKQSKGASQALFDVANKALPKEKQQSIIDSVFGTTTEQPATAKSASEAARERYESTLQGMFDRRREALEKQQTENTKLAKYNALGNLLTTLVQPIGWAIGGKGSGVTGGVQPYDNRQYLEAFNRAVKASDDLRNLGASEDEFELKMAYDEYNRAVNEEQRQKIRQEDEEDYRKRRELDAEYGVNRAKTGQALNEERKSKAIDAWTIHNNGMTLWQYINNINSMFPGYFGEDFNPNKEAIDAIEAEIRSNKPKATVRKGGNGRDKGRGSGGDKPTFNVEDKSSVTLS